GAFAPVFGTRRSFVAPCGSAGLPPSRSISSAATAGAWAWIGLPPLRWMRSSQEARAKGRPWLLSQSMISFLSLKPWAAMAAIHSARPRPVRAFRPSRNSRSSSRSSLAMVYRASKPGSRALLVVEIRLPEPLLQMPLLRLDGKLEDGDREHRRQDRQPDVERDLRETEQDQSVGNVNRMAPEAEWAVGDELGGALVGEHRGAGAGERDEPPDHERNAGDAQPIADDARRGVVVAGPRQRVEPAREPAQHQRGNEQDRRPWNG